MSFKFQNFPILLTERLRLRKIEKSDGAKIFFLRTDKEVNKYIYRPKPHKNIKEAEAFIEKLEKGMENGENINWGIILQGEADVIGSICLWNFSQDRRTAEIGFDLDPKFHNNGIMSEALTRVISFGFLDLNLEKIEAFTNTENASSRRILIKNNFKLNKNRRDTDNPNNIIFELKRSGYPGVSN